MSPRAFPEARTLRVLSLDGGGVKGYTTLLILKRVFRTLNDVAGRNEVALLKPCHVFDLIVGDVYRGHHRSHARTAGDDD